MLEQQLQLQQLRNGYNKEFKPRFQSTKNVQIAPHPGANALTNQQQNNHPLTSQAQHRIDPIQSHQNGQIQNHPQPQTEPFNKELSTTDVLNLIHNTMQTLNEFAARFQNGSMQQTHQGM